MDVCPWLAGTGECCGEKGMAKGRERVLVAGYLDEYGARVHFYYSDVVKAYCERDEREKGLLRELEYSVLHYAILLLEEKRIPHFAAA